METSPPREHWQRVYREAGSEERSWFEATPRISLDLVGATGVGRDAALIDVGGGDGRLADALLGLGYSDLTVLDVSDQALERARRRLGEQAERIHWIESDVRRFEPPRRYDVWHDRAAFHFLTAEEDRRAYLRALDRGLAVGGHLLIATFSELGPRRCSGLPVCRYSADELCRTLGPDFELAESLLHPHPTPSGGEQSFRYSRFVRN